MVLDTDVALMYLLPPVPDAGQLLNPPGDTPANLIGILHVHVTCSCLLESFQGVSDIASFLSVTINLARITFT